MVSIAPFFCVFPSSDGFTGKCGVEWIRVGAPHNCTHPGIGRRKSQYGCVSSHWMYPLLFLSVLAASGAGSVAARSMTVTFL